jgi:hypothetical protein
MNDFMEYSQNTLPFNGKPNYDYLTGLLRDMFHKADEESKVDFKFDWIIQKEKKMAEKEARLRAIELACNPVKEDPKKPKRGNTKK